MKHLEPTESDRGFVRLPHIVVGPNAVRAYESSAARGPHIWLKVNDTEYGDDGPVVASLHLTAEQAWQLAEQLMTLVTNHYQGDARPEQRAGDLVRAIMPCCPPCHGPH